jgi:hypothetical protein
MAWQPPPPPEWRGWADSKGLPDPHLPDELSVSAIETVLARLGRLSVHPEQAAKWAHRWDIDVVSDPAVAFGLARLRDCNRVLSPSAYLFTPADFRASLEELRDKVGWPQGDRP